MRIEKRALSLCIVLFCLLIVFFICVFSNKSIELIGTSDFIPNVNRNIAQGGDVRLIYDNSMLYKSGVDYNFSQVRTALNAYIDKDSYASVFERIRDAYVTDDYSLYFKKNNYQYDLYYQNRERGERKCIAENTRMFLQIDGQYVYYCKNCNSHMNADELWRYNLETGENQILLKEVAAYFINEGVLYTTSCQTEQIAVSVVEHINIIRSYDLKTMEMLFEETIPLDFVALNIRLINDFVVLWSNRCRMYIYNAFDNIGEYLIQSGHALSAQANTCLNYNDNYLFVSMKVNKLTKIDSLSGVETYEVGTWKYDWLTKEWQQLSEKVYDALYVFDQEYVFGIIDDKVYRIAIEETSEKLVG